MQCSAQLPKNQRGHPPSPSPETRTLLLVWTSPTLLYLLLQVQGLAKHRASRQQAPPLAWLQLRPPQCAPPVLPLQAGCLTRPAASLQIRLLAPRQASLATPSLLQAMQCSACLASWQMHLPALPRAALGPNASRCPLPREALPACPVEVYPHLWMPLPVGPAGSPELQCCRMLARVPCLLRQKRLRCQILPALVGSPRQPEAQDARQEASR
mmetsp:Transcript_65153/g.210056  ORF Transcript_65153/g.210056 Transcript_65153/m.210056 type:complete len:212 (+) Transcript_65153:1485-2120(+)